MQVSRISSKGQVTVPKLIRDLLHLSEGDQITFIIEEGKISISKADFDKLGFTQKVVT